MHVTILALGSYGDVLPFVILGRALRDAGCQVRLASFQNFATLAQENGLDFYPISGDATSLLSGPQGLALAESDRNVIRMYLGVMRSFGAQVRRYARDFSALATSGTDAIVNQLPGGLFGYDLAQKLDVPLILAAVMPLVRTRAFPMLAFPRALRNIPGYNTLTYRLAEQLLWQGFRSTVNRWRREVLGLRPASLTGYMGQIYAQELPVLNGFSRHVVPRPPDWGRHIHVTGYWFPPDEPWQPPDDLRRFIEAGTPPVFVGFGSMPLRHPQGTMALILEALANSGQRAILGAGWAGLATTGRTRLPPDVFPIDYAPYDWLFPRMAAVVHHGGSGTTAAGLRAGVPALVVPFLFDQHFWGRRLAELGVAPPPLPFRSLSAARLAQAITAAVSDQEMRRRAATLGHKIRAETGLEAAVAIIRREIGG